MKIILSRKGFDSANGGIVSPIMEDGTLISFPIPSDDRDNFEDLIYGGQPYTKILQDLKYKKHPKYHNCHLDPDLTIDRRKTRLMDGVRFLDKSIHRQSIFWKMLRLKRATCSFFSVTTIRLDVLMVNTNT